MAGITDWVAERIDSNHGVSVVERTAEDFLILKADGRPPFPAAVIGVKDVIRREDVAPVLSLETKPQFVVNVPSRTLWSGAAIRMIHATPAAFGTLGELLKAANAGNVPQYRNKTWDFFERAIRQHSRVCDVSRVYGEVFEAQRLTGGSVTIALVDAYHMSAEDVRNARDRFGEFDVAVKISSYGSITDEAEEAARSIGAEAVTLKGLMRKLAQ